jgi:mannose-6-phosphate isomerase-like protein (cupin superfamily)
MTSTASAQNPFHFTLEEGRKSPIAAGQRSAQLFSHGSMKLRYYAPKGVDEQTPHQQDEVYVVVSGDGRFQNGTEFHPFQTGDVLFVPAGREHRFLEFSADFATWVIFYGPAGGEEAS